MAVLSSIPEVVWYWTRIVGAAVVLFFFTAVGMHWIYGPYPSKPSFTYTEASELGTPIFQVSGEDAMTGHALLSGRLVGNASYTPGYSGKGLSLAADGYVEVSESPLLDLSTPFTVSTWIHADDIEGKQHIISRYRYGQRRGYLLALTDKGSVEFSAGNGTHRIGIYSTRRITPGTWHQLTATYRDGTLHLYLDGRSVGYTRTVPGGIAHADGPLIIGSSKGAGGFDGVLDDVVIRTRDVLRRYQVNASLNGSTYLRRPETSHPASPFAVMAWVRPGTSPKKQHIVSTFNYSANTGYTLALTATGKAEFSVGNGTHRIGIYGIEPLEAGAWHRITGTLSRGRLYLSVDGSSVGYQKQVNGGIAHSTAPFTIGRAADYEGGYLTGAIDTVYLLNRSLATGDSSG